ncbi:MAG: LytTR family transcriptional regulator DNA-binding domain-containing protein [Leadbetterella sp.]
MRKKVIQDYTTSLSPFEFIHVGSRTAIQPADIVLIEADISYSLIHLQNGDKVLVSTNIQKLQERLLPFQSIVRAHRSYLINTDYLTDVEGHKATLINNLSCGISRRRLVDVKRFAVN